MFISQSFFGDNRTLILIWLWSGLNSLRWWLQRKQRRPAARRVCHGHESVRSVVSSMRVRTPTYMSTRTMWTMNWFVTSACNLYSNQWILPVATLIAFIASVTSWKSRTSALWIASVCSCISAGPPVCWWGTCWTSSLWCAPTLQSASSRCSAVNCSLICTTGKILGEMLTVHEF